MSVEGVDVSRHLAALPLFRGMDKAELHRLAGDCQLRWLARGDMVFRVGEHCHDFLVALAGQIKLFAVSPAGQEKVIDLVGPGHSVADAVMFSDQPCSLNAQALTEALLLVAPKAIVLSAIARDRQFALGMLASISSRVHSLLQDVEACALHTGLERVIGYLLRDRDIVHGDRGAAFTVSLPVAKATIASLLSLTPEYFSRMLHALESAALVEIDGREIRVVDARRLAALSPAALAPSAAPRSRRDPCVPGQSPVRP